MTVGQPVTKKRVTILDGAERAGVSRSTVSAALAGRRMGIYISEDTRRRVWQVAKEIGYPLKRLRTRDPRTLRVAIFCRGVPVYDRAVLTLCDLLNRQGFQTLVDMKHDPPEACEAARDLFRRHHAQAAILVGSRNTLDGVPSDDMPCVLVGDVPDGARVWRVSMDNEGGGRAVGEHLWSLGHRRVGMVVSQASLAAQKRWRGLRSVWQLHGCHCPDDRVLALPPNSGPDTVREALLGFLDEARRQRRPLTALFCWHDDLAMLVLSILTEVGVRVPHDVSLVGFNDVHSAAFLQPPLTTVRQALGQVAALAMQLLMERFQDPNQDPKAFTLAYQLVVRGSTAPVPGGGGLAENHRAIMDRSEMPDDGSHRVS